MVDMMASPTAISNGLLQLSNVIVRFSGITAIDGVSTVFRPGEINGLIGPNGAGKTTLLNAICGFANVTAGDIHLDTTNLTGMHAGERVRHGIVRGFQTVRLLERETVFDNVLVGCERFSQPNFFAQILNLPVQRRSAARDAAATWSILRRLGLAADAHRPVSQLPFAPRRLTEIARLLVARPEVLLLDEPAAGLDVKDRAALSETLRQYHATDPFTMIVIEHDVDLVRQMCSHCVALQMGRIVAEGTPAAVLADPQVRQAYFGENDA
jgi:branched-chain amino acid transport system ATP-binding protein